MARGHEDRFADDADPTTDEATVLPPADAAPVVTAGGELPGVPADNARADTTDDDAA